LFLPITLTTSPTYEPGSWRSCSSSRSILTVQIAIEMNQGKIHKFISRECKTIWQWIWRCTTKTRQYIIFLVCKNNSKSFRPINLNELELEYISVCV
jgi:hypothetical protein